MPAVSKFTSNVANTIVDESTINLKYPKLENADRQFRMLVLEPSRDFSTDIKCHIHNRSQYPNPAYEALSYRWGDPKDTTPICIRLTEYQGEQESDETPYLPWPVTRNLKQALRALRLPDRDRLLWVDALCINQNDDVERGRQVRIMGQIYQNCVRDLLWLGPENAQISRAMRLILKIQGHGESGHKKTCRSMVETESTTFSAFSDQDWDDLKSLILHPVEWGRVWIIQELILSPEFTLVCGKDTLDWNCIDSVLENNRDVLKKIDLQGPELGALLEVIGKVSTIRTYRMPLEITTPLFSKSLLTTFFFLDWEATDGRDKVYAVLSLTTDGKDLGVDYQKTMDQLSIDFAKTCLAQGSVRILSHNTTYCVAKTQYLKQYPSSHANSTTKQELLVPRRKDWPTWIPDLSDDIIKGAKISGLSVAGVSKYNACGTMGSMKALQVIQCKITPSLGLLMAGIFVDSVALVSPITLVSENETPRNRWTRDALAWAPPETKQPNAILQLYPWSDSQHESVVSAYWRTIITDRRADKRLNAEDLRQHNWYADISEGSDIPEENTLLVGWRFGKTAAGMYCMLPPQSKVGDTICVPLGGQVPLLLRSRNGNDELYELIGEVYVHGVMDGMGMLRAVANMSRMLQADPNHDYEHMATRLRDQTMGTQFYMQTFHIV
ncbi:hypothetical protein COCSADRAFT_185606 [Bipolaris sorokiniana ND90Pr]|uniref:Heterokaryon incompatibility domain-containing protein n=1 Tax=Cochliobolus sativus (strain ND90Pr / ATCC 201652) TaxID=665912 RepID=M2S7X4_COCSN|nr:uncharacterized protein COCSADRAFT_185606 [Bipolaris sorokiniana ND90Pr]EMD58540.1 hypothetical protein COCSADRAFT_185606 [Bipolaris sorokiniana ND90Pr]